MKAAKPQTLDPNLEHSPILALRESRKLTKPVL
jgi:hypothetical protein